MSTRTVHDMFWQMRRMGMSNYRIWQLLFDVHLRRNCTTEFYVRHMRTANRRGWGVYDV